MGQNLLDTFLEIQAAIGANLERHGATLGLSASQLVVVRDVEDHPGTSLKDLCSRCGIKQSAASRLVDSLVGSGVLARKPCSTSRRAVALELGPAMAGQFCRTQALAAALPGLAGSDPGTIVTCLTGLDALKKMALYQGAAETTAGTLG